ncbi:hypothetical protein [Undibacterium sp. RuRC25W]|uniref:hypothetical protein n=1 Tax=Undibacterium sp. RuRC25W TaxID=3413047 RepID=UPI003BF53570
MNSSGVTTTIIGSDAAYAKALAPLVTTITHVTVNTPVQTQGLKLIIAVESSFYTEPDLAILCLVSAPTK